MLTVIKVVFSAVLFLVGFSSLAADNLKMFETPLEQVSWKYSGNVFSCEISHKVKNFGKVALLALPGQNLTLNVYADNVQFNDILSVLLV